MSDPAVVALGDQKLDDVDLGQDAAKEVGDKEDVFHDTETGASPDAVDHKDAPGVAPEKEGAGPTAPGLAKAPTLLEPEHLTSHPADELHRPDSPTTSLITSLRSQLHLLSEQSHQLNTKLVASISRHADLEDQHDSLQRERDELRSKNAELTKVKETWEESMKTGLYVEQAQIKDEMQRLAAGLVEEERKRGSAEQRRQAVENDIDELAASLFDQANTMVAQERMGRLEAETRLKSTEDNLAAAEAAVRDMQLHLQSLPNTAAAASASPAPLALTRRFLSSHVPYLEFASFVQHIRSLRPLRETSKTTFPPPQVTNLLAQPFLARAIAEDHDPTLRLDAAPDLSWLSRRSVSAAISAGELVIEPISANSLLATTTTPPAEIGCSLCGKAVFPSMVPQSPAVSHFGPPPLHPAQRNSASRFSLKPFFNSTATTTSPGPGTTAAALTSPLPSPVASPNPAVPTTPRSTSGTLPSVYIFRIAKPSTAGAADKSTSSSETQSKPYPLCKSGWCLERLRATCELWHFVRTGIVQVIWMGDDGYLLQSEVAQPAEGERGEVVDLTEEKPALPPRKKSGWGLGFKSTPGNNTTPVASGSGSSWTKGWGGGASSRSGTASPPPTAGTGEKRSSIGAGSIGAEKGADEGVLGAPIDLDTEVKDKDKGKGKEKEVAVGDEPDVPVATSDEGLLHPSTAERTSTDLPRAESALSLNSTNRSEQFTTPQSEHADLLDAQAAELATPRAETADRGGGAEVKEPTKEEEGVMEKNDTNAASPIIGPPPVPKRAAGRTRLNGNGNGDGHGSKDLDAESREASPVPLPAAGRVDAAEAEAEAGPVETPRAAPPLPPRHPRTPKQDRESRNPGDKTFLRDVDVGQGEEEEWESKTWKMVLKLKEQMWKTRVGVVDAQPDTDAE